MKSFYNTESAYGPISKFFHWVISFLVILMLAVSYFLGDLPKNLLAPAFNAHKLMGITILALMILRASWALMNSKPTLPGAKLWERCAERLVHWSLYLTLLAMPLAGWIGSSASGKPPSIGRIKLSLPLEKSETLSNLAFSVHNTLAIIIITLVSLHVLAALYHHYFKKDKILQRMLP